MNHPNKLGQAFCHAFGLDGQRVKRLQIDIEAGQVPSLKVTVHPHNVPAEQLQEVTKDYELVSSSELRAVHERMIRAAERRAIGQAVNRIRSVIAAGPTQHALRESIAECVAGLLEGNKSTTGVRDLIDVLSDSNAAKADRIDRLGETVQRLHAEIEVLNRTLSAASALRALIADDAFAASFQTMAQYRSALLTSVREPT